MENDFEPFRAIVRRLTPLVNGQREWWREAVRRWANDPPLYGDDEVLPVPLPVRLTRDERIALLAAVFDACVADAATIDPWRDPRDLPELPAAPGGDPIPREYQHAIRYEILVRDRVPNLRDQWDTHEAAIEMLIADIEREVSGAHVENQTAWQDDGKRPRSAKVNDRMKAEMAANLETVKGWTAKQWASELGCAKSTVIETETWRSLSLLRQQAKAERRNDRRHK